MQQEACTTRGHNTVHQSYPIQDLVGYNYLGQSPEVPALAVQGGYLKVPTLVSGEYLHWLGGYLPWPGMYLPWPGMGVPPVLTDRHLSVDNLTSKVGTDVCGYAHANVTS